MMVKVRISIAAAWICQFWDRAASRIWDRYRWTTAELTLCDTQQHANYGRDHSPRVGETIRVTNKFFHIDVLGFGFALGGFYTRELGCKHTSKVSKFYPFLCSNALMIRIPGNFA